MKHDKNVKLAPDQTDMFYFSVEEAKEWVMRLKPQGGCNLLKAMKHIYKLKDIDSIVLILGSV